MCYRTKCRRSGSNRLGVGRRSQQCWGKLEFHSLRWERGCYHRNTPLCLCHHTKFRRSKSNRLARIIEILQKILIFLCVTRLIRSLKVVGTDTDQSAANDFQLAIHSNREPVLYRLRDRRRLVSEIEVFATPLYLTESSPWNFVTTVELKKQVSCPCRMVERV